MTKEELEKEADKYADGYTTPDLDFDFRAHIFEASKEGYLAGAEPREKRIAELEAQIEKMKCCENCKGVCNSDDVAHFCKDNDYKLWEIRK